jgi:apolipoprotein N-acyltransferase
MATESTPSEQLAMAQHPDIMALRERYERAAETPQASAIEGLTFMAGTYAAISAWVVGFDGSSPRLAASNLIVGIAVALLAFGYATFYGRTHVLAWVAPMLGAWLIVAPWVVLRGSVDRPTEMVWSNVIVGACVVLLGLSITGLARMRPRVYRRP